MFFRSVLIFFFIGNIFSFAVNLTEKQIDNLKECIRISNIFGNSPDIVCSILLNETIAGKEDSHKIGDKFLKPFDRSYGIMQVRLRTAKFLIDKFDLDTLRQLPDEQILVHLIEDNRFNLAMANLYILLLREKYHDNEKKVVIAYNSGHYNPNNIRYYKRYLENKKIFRKIKEELKK